LDLLDAFFGQGVLVAGLRGGQDEEVVAVLVLDQGLVEVGLAVDHVDQVVHHAALAAHDEVEVAQADVEVDHRGLEAAQREAGGNAGAGGGFADAALAGRYYDDACHDVPFRFLTPLQLDWSAMISSMQIVGARQPDLGAAPADRLGMPRSKVRYTPAMETSSGPKLVLKMRAEVSPRAPARARPRSGP
jgi:hypothetical protein